MNHPDAITDNEELLLKSDIVLLVDLVTEHSREVKLVTHEDLMNEFISKTSESAPLSLQKVRSELDAIPAKEQELRSCADDSPEGKERRRLLSRRQMFRSLFNGELSVSQLREEQNEAKPAREITPEYFEKVLSAALDGRHGLETLESWDAKRYYHFEPLLSSSYARLLAAENNPYELMLDTVRECSRLYPRPIGIFSFEFAPFNLDPQVIQDALDRFGKDENAKDIRVSVTSAGSVYLYSSKYLEDDYADFLAEEMDSGESEML